MSRWLLLLVIGCSTPSLPSPPIIDSLDMPTTATLDAMGKATLTGMVQFHDSDDNVTTVVTRIPATNQSTSGSIPPQSVGIVGISLQLSGTKGSSVDYEITLVDKSGLSSAPAKRSVTFN
jgi:hypothetical protein